MDRVTVTFETTEEVKEQIERILDREARKFFDRAELTADAIEWQQQLDVSVELLAVAQQIKQGGK